MSRRFIKSPCMAALALLAALCLPPAASAQQAAGVVIDVEGRWILGGTRDISRGQKVPAGGSISVVSPTRYDYIIIANLNGDVMASRRCGNLSECDQPLNLPSPPRVRPSVFGVILETGMRLLLGEPDRFSRHGTRGGLSPVPDGVAQLGPGGLELGPLFEGRDKGTYYVRLRPAGGSARRGTRDWVGPLSLNWSPGGRGLITSRDLRPGLYEVDVTDAEGARSLAEDDYAWVLVARGPAYRRALTSFGQAKALRQRWGKQVSPEAGISFLRAYLKHLSDSGRYL
ncbi:MAG TPA: hypothetical protein VGX48_08135 [Pyrinomonadaceae bacterium]|jgi:hypothetical protein|nr:hypothetical protein [Pyrinomonadaceae bacterium]